MTDIRGESESPILELFVYLCVRDAAAAIEFYRTAFGAREIMRLQEPGGRIMHAELMLGPALVMLADEAPEYGIHSPHGFGGTGVTIHLHVRNLDELAARAVAAGATMTRKPANEGHGERQCRLRDPFGHEWLLGQELEKISSEEILRRFESQYRR